VKAKIFKHPKKRSHGLCAGESDDFQTKEHFSSESGSFQQPRSVFHGLLAGESGNHVRFIHVLKIK
jgi:hypothetical protein